jgi:hypothetical protein
MEAIQAIWPKLEKLPEEIKAKIGFGQQQQQ